MPFKLFVRLPATGEGLEEREYLFNQAVVRVGRRDANDVQLKDTRRLVSGWHAEIRTRDGQFFLVDVGSKNGTQLNGERLTVGKEYLLADGDEVGIGDFRISFRPVALEEVQPQPIPPGDDSTSYLPDVREKAQVLADALSRLYEEHRDAGPDERTGRLEATIRQAIEGLDPGTALRLLDLIQARFAEPGYLQAQILNRGWEPRIELPLHKLEHYRAAYAGLARIARRYLEDWPEFQNREEIEQLVERIDRSISVMLRCLADAVKGRRQFEAEFDVEATRIFSWRPNPVKLADDEREIGRHLMDWRMPNASVEQVVSDLEEAFVDLALHQMGLMAGFKECLRGVLSEIDPNRLQAECDSRPVGWGPFRFPANLWPVRDLMLWARFKERHRELMEEEVRTFETILGPLFSKGYLSVQKKKPV